MVISPSIASGDLDMSSFEEMDEVSDSGSDFEAQMKSVKRKQKAVPGAQQPKRPRRKSVVRASSSHSSSSIPSPSGQQQQQQQQQLQPSLGISRQASPVYQGVSPGDIYAAVRSGKSAMVTVVDEWLDSYKQSRESGLLVLVNFIVQCCGCKGVVSREMFDNMQNAEIISTLTKEFNEDSAHYPLCTPGPQLKRFKAGLCEFALVLVQSCQNSLIYDEFLFPSLLALLTGLSDSQVRAFRHTSTLLVTKLMTGLVEVAVKLSVQLQTAQRHYDMENSKREGDQASERMEKLQGIRSELLENREELTSLMNSTFRGVFVHRYRDLLPEIRAACIEELGAWLRMDPEDFLNDGCLKYLGWTLYDKQSPVRLVCVRALQGLYQENEFIGRLELFTGRFRERILSMVLDKDPDVAVEVVSLLLLIHQKTEEGLTEEECSHIYPMVYVAHRGLASAASVFLYNKLKSLIVSDSQEMGFLHVLISFYIHSQFHDHGAYLVDSLWSVAGSELKDWEAVTAYLLQETCDEKGLSDEEEGALLELMICAIRRAAEATPPAGRTQGKKTLSVKDKKIQAQDRRRITNHFIPLLPQLLAKYSSDVEKVSLLLKVPLYFDLEMYSSGGRLEKYLDLLLSQICGIVKKHTVPTVLEACARLASTFCSDCYTFSSRAHLAFSQLLDGLTDCFGTHSNDLLQGIADEDDVYTAATALKRIAAFSSAKDLTGWKLFDPCVQLLKSSVDSIGLDKELMVAALKCAALHLMWAKQNVINSHPAEAELKRLKREVRSFCNVCQKCVSLDQAEIRDQAFELLCDLLLIYSGTSVRSEPALQMLVHQPSDSLRFELATFILDYVFTGPDDVELTDEDDEQMKITILRKKRNQLAGYCKLVIYGVLDLTAATEILKHYDKHYKDFGDVIKETLSKTKLINPVQSAKTVCLCLQQMFSQMLLEEHSNKDLDEIRDLAKRLAMSFGIDLHRVRKPLVALHSDGICFAVRDAEDAEEGGEQHPNLPFFEILSEFSFKLLQQDRAQLAAFLKAECRGAALSCPSVRIYQCSLEGHSSSRLREEGEGGGRGSKAVSSHNTPAAKRSRTTAQDAVSSAGRVSWSDNSIQSNLPTPAFTSTVQRQPTEQATPDCHEATDSAHASDSAELGSEDELFGSRMRKVKPKKRRLSSSSHPSPIVNKLELDSHITLLSLIEEDNAEGDEEPEIEDFHSDSDQDAAYTLPSTRHTSTSILDELFQ